MTKLLLIDDDEPFARMLAERLHREGFAVSMAGDGKPGVALFQQERFPLVILDIILPEMEGLETLRELRGLDPDVKVIAISGGGAGDPGVYLHSAELLGARAAFTKPLDWPPFLAKLRELLGEA